MNHYNSILLRGDYDLGSNDVPVCMYVLEINEELIMKKTVNKMNWQVVIFNVLGHYIA